MNTPNSILATLAYHDIFNYPLTEEEIHKYLVENKAKEKTVELHLKKLLDLKMISLSKGYFCLKGREVIIPIRLKRKKASRAKYKKAKTYAQILKAIPQIKLVALTGALSMENSTAKDDIDYAIITQKGQLWTARLGANLLLAPFKRWPGSKTQKDRVCLNLFLSENSLKIRTQNLYIAHEIAQLKPIWQRGNTYSSYVKANSWVKNYLPNWKADFTGSNSKKVGKLEKQSKIISHVLTQLEYFSKKFQLSYMQSKITTEQIGEGQLFFHPSQTQNWVLGQYQKKLKQLHILR